MSSLRRIGIAQAPAWPTRPLRIVIAYPPGGSTDVAGRLLAEMVHGIPDCKGPVLVMIGEALRMR